VSSSKTKPDYSLKPTPESFTTRIIERESGVTRQKERRRNSSTKKKSGEKHPSVVRKSEGYENSSDEEIILQDTKIEEDALVKKIVGDRGELASKTKQPEGKECSCEASEKGS